MFGFKQVWSVWEKLLIDIPNVLWSPLTLIFGPHKKNENDSPLTISIQFISSNFVKNHPMIIHEVQFGFNQINSLWVNLSFHFPIGILFYNYELQWQPSCKNSDQHKKNTHLFQIRIMLQYFSIGFYVKFVLCRQPSFLST